MRMLTLSCARTGDRATVTVLPAYAPVRRFPANEKDPTLAPKKKVTGLIKLQIQAGAANPAPPVGPALGSHGVNIMEFCKAYKRCN